MSTKIELAFRLIVVATNWVLECLREKINEGKAENDNTGDQEKEQ